MLLLTLGSGYLTQCWCQPSSSSRGVEITRTGGSLDSVTFSPSRKPELMVLWFWNILKERNVWLLMELNTELVIIDGIEYRTCDYWRNQIQNLWLLTELNTELVIMDGIEYRTCDYKRNAIRASSFHSDLGPLPEKKEPPVLWFRKHSFWKQNWWILTKSNTRPTRISNPPIPPPQVI